MKNSRISPGPESPRARPGEGASRCAGGPRTPCAALLLAAVALLFVPGCGSEESAAARDRLADLVVETREIEIDSLGSKVNPEDLDISRKITASERSIHDIHERFERSLEAFEGWNAEIAEETEDLRRIVETMKGIDRGKFANSQDAWARFWAVADETSRILGLEWRFR